MVQKTRDSLKEKNGDYIPSLVFQHIPMFEHYNVLKQVKKSEKGAIPAFRIHKGEYYKIDETKCVPGSVLLEPPSIPDINTGEFEALKEKVTYSVYMLPTTIKTAMLESTTELISVSLNQAALMFTATARNVE